MLTLKAAVPQCEQLKKKKNVSDVTVRLEGAIGGAGL